VCLTNDRGVHICKSMLAYQKLGQGDSPEKSGLKGDHFVGKYYVLFEKNGKENPSWADQAQQMLQKWEDGDLEILSLWHKMNSWVFEAFQETYQRLSTSFDKHYFESQSYLLGKQFVLQGLKEKIFFQKDDGSVWIKLTVEDEKLLLSQNGTTVYITQDIATFFLRQSDFDFDQMIYVVASEQDYHFKVLFEIISQIDPKIKKESLYHLSYGMVNLPSGKMKSREGTAVDADHLLDQLTVLASSHTENRTHVEDPSALNQMIADGAIRYFLLKVSPKPTILFDPQNSIDLHGQTAVFIQYTHARISSILSKSRELFKEKEETEHLTIENFPQDISEEEKSLLIALAEWPKRVFLAAEEKNPAIIAQDAYQMSKLFNHFYELYPILQEKDSLKRIFRLWLLTKVKDYLLTQMDLLAIKLPEKM
jgi:arginyl-tRNA synthetase